MFPNQAKCIPEFARNRDVIAEAPTGSGKTLAYVAPVLEILSKRTDEWSKHQVGAIILVPNRELAVQISNIVSVFLDSLKLSQITFVGGKKIGLDAEKFQKFGGNIIISTPGRLNGLIENHEVFESGFNFNNCLKTVEMLILDEADRLFEQTFQSSITDILEHLPKQKRVGLFSATQSKYEDELKRVGLRNPVNITVKSEENGESSRTPVTLKNYFTVTEPFSKFATLCQFIKSHRKSKILLFLSTCACVDYFGHLLKHILLSKQPKKQKNKRRKKAADCMQILTIHGKKRSKRASIFERFRSAKGSCLLVCTDVMARGLDVPDINWVIQFDVPRTVNFFLHRCGRTARCGQIGNSLIFLLPCETDYLEFLERNQEISLEKLAADCGTQYSEKIFETVRKLASEDRSLLIKGTKAFVSYIQSYERHDCKIICHVKDLDIVNMAHSYGLLRLPNMPELRGRDLSDFRRCEIKTWSIPYKSKAMEEQRQEALKQKNSNITRSVPPVDRIEVQKDTSSVKKLGKRKRKMTTSDMKEIENDYKLLKSFKKGKISKNEFENELLN